jgi:malate synthase
LAAKAWIAHVSEEHCMLIEQLVRVRAPALPETSDILTHEAIAFLARLEGEFGVRRRMLLQRRTERQEALDAGQRPDFLHATQWIRDDEEWMVAPIPRELQDRRVEITGPTDRKMMINALNSGARVFMADFEDANAPTWENMIRGQANLREAIAGTLEFTSPEGKPYRLKEKVATLMVRPRGWHLDEDHVSFEGRAMSASLFDFGLYAFHNAAPLAKKGTGVNFYLPKLEGHLEARLWNEVFEFTERELGLRRGSIKCTALIETILGVFEMEEILYELRDRIVGLNAGRWDYIFSIIKKFRHWAAALMPDRAQISMTVPFMRAYTELLVRTCHKRGAHAIGGMAAFVPSRRDPQVNENALAKVREDKVREAHDGFDGTWVAHPDLVPVAMEVFDEALGNAPHQKSNLREDVQVSKRDLLNFGVPEGRITEAGLRSNISVGVQYLAAWLGGNGAVAINNLMEDTATAEISRAQVWQWLHHPDLTLDDGRPITPKFYRGILEEEVSRLRTSLNGDTTAAYRLQVAAVVFDHLVQDDEFAEFLTIPAGRELLDITEDESHVLERMNTP